MIRAIPAACDGAYGVRRLHRELVEAGEHVSRKRVRRLMRESGIRAVQTRRFTKTTDSKHTLGFAPNLLNQGFATTAPDRVWVGDIERHDALSNPAVMKEHRPRLVAASREKLRAA